MSNDYDDRYDREPREPSRYEMMELLSVEMDKRDTIIMRRLEEIAKTQDTIAAKLLQWETGAVIIRWLAIATASFVATAMALTEWFRNHYR